MRHAPLAPSAPLRSSLRASPMALRDAAAPCYAMQRVQRRTAARSELSRRLSGEISQSPRTLCHGYAGTMNWVNLAKKRRGEELSRPGLQFDE